MANKKLNSIKFPGLNDTYTIPDAQVNSDWNASTGVSSILNKPTIPAAQINANWNATTGVASILNKPTIPNVPSWALASTKPTYTYSEVGALPSTTTYVSTVNGQSGAVTINTPLVLRGSMSVTLSATHGTGTFTLSSGNPNDIPSHDTVYIVSSSNLSTDDIVLQKNRYSSYYYAYFTTTFRTTLGTVYVEIEGTPDDEYDWDYATWNVRYWVLQDKLTSYVSSFNGNTGAVTFTESDPTVPAWAKASTKPTYTAAEVGALPDTTIIPTKTSQLTNDSGFLTPYAEETITTSGAVTKALDTRTLYHFTGALTSLTITLNAPAQGQIAHYHFDFLSGSAAPTLTLPNTVTMPDSFSVEASMRYEIDILNNFGTVVEWTN